MLYTTSVLPLLTVSFWIGGMVAISRQDVKQHQLRMLTGLGFHLLGLGTLGWFQLQGLLAYRGPFPAAFRLLWWLQGGLGVVSALLVAVALWSVHEGVWMLHRRAGMVGVLSGVVSSLAALVGLLMTL